MIADIKSIARRRDGLIMAQKSAESGAAVAEQLPGGRVGQGAFRRRASSSAASRRRPAPYPGAPAFSRKQPSFKRKFLLDAPATSP